MNSLNTDINLIHVKLQSVLSIHDQLTQMIGVLVGIDLLKNYNERLKNFSIAKKNKNVQPQP